MMRHFISLLFFVWLLAEVASGDSITIASYNVRNYLTMDRLVEGQWRSEYPKPEVEKEVVRETIRAVSPDIIALQEMGTKAHLEELRRDLANEGLEYEGMAWLEGSDSERHVAAMWRSDLKIRVIGHRDLSIRYFGQPDRVKRGLLELIVTDAEGEWSLFIAHLKSKYTDVKSDPMSSHRRTLEARAVRDRIIERFPDLEKRRYLIVGDLNDSPDSSALKALMRKGDRTLSVPIEISDVNGARWTHYYRKGDSYTRVDYILRSPGWRRLESVTGSIFHRSDYYVGSDHRMISVVLPISKLRP